MDRVRAALTRPLYEPLAERPFVYFPLHMTSDYKIKRIIPHCVDQAAIVELISDAPVEEQARQIVDMATMTEDGRRRVGFRLFWG